MQFFVRMVLALALISAAVAQESSPIEAWGKDLRIRPLFGPNAPFHSIHTYFNTSPESPDGRWILFFRSTDPEAQIGDIYAAGMDYGEMRPIAKGVETEDGHRVACQQWVLGGRAVLFHDLRDGEWVVVLVDMRTLNERILATGRQVGFASPFGEWVPIYGPHWEPGEHRDLELVSLRTGEIQKAVSIDSVKPAYEASSGAEYLTEQFGDKPTSVFFPILSPDESQVIFKLSSPSIGGFRSSQASLRKGIFVYDLAAAEYRFVHGKWGHPAWHPSGDRILSMWANGPVLVDLESGQVSAKSQIPDWMSPNGHPSSSPNGEIFVTDGILTDPDKDRKWWGVAVGDFEGSEWIKLREFDNSKGESSWRGSHPHPVFSADGRRIYFNVSEDQWTRLWVAERKTKR
ncbi:MAG: Tol biopolymer transport system component [Verrucomicrobiales bacterium]|jgi:Tol biopolymer transport system component